MRRRGMLRRGGRILKFWFGSGLGGGGLRYGLGLRLR